MMRSLQSIRNWLKSTDLSGLVIPSTDEYLSEFPPSANRRLQWATGFRGSTGLSVILRDCAALFLDGRYQLQGRSDVDSDFFSIEFATLAARREWLKRSLGRRARIGLVPDLHSMPDVLQWRNLASELDFEIVLLQENPLDELWKEGRPADHAPEIDDYSIRYAGESYETKCAALVEHILSSGMEALLVADPEDVSWLLNLRSSGELFKTKVGEWHVVPSCTCRALIRRDGRVALFVDAKRLTPRVATRGQGIIDVMPAERITTALRESASKGPVGADVRRTSASLVMLIEEAGKLVPDDTIARRRWRKHAAEVQSAKQAHVIDAAAVVRFMAWLQREIPRRRVTEFDAAEQLEVFRSESPAYKGASMPLMSASGPSGAQPHYVPRREGCRLLNDHPIYWMDSGGQYLGGSTDNTITLALGAPEPKHVLAHTLVLKGFIALASARVPVGTRALHLDTIARQALWSEGLDFAHNTGHGVGNHLNIHEGPLIGREPGPATNVPIEPGMILTNEPGYYSPGDFGLRIESHMAVVGSCNAGFLEFETISRLPIDPVLVDFERLSSREEQWLADYHRTILADLEPLLDAESAVWLRRLVSRFTERRGSA